MLSIARLILAYNPLTTSYDSVCRLISTPLKWVVLRRLVIKKTPNIYVGRFYLYYVLLRYRDRTSLKLASLQYGMQTFSNVFRLNLLT